MIKEYEYKCVDSSILTPMFRDHIAKPVLQFVPTSIHPNLITVVSFLFSLTGLWLAYFLKSGVLTNALVALCIFLYLLFDHLDGMQAKRKGGGSALGEFLDHFLDVLVNGVIILTTIVIFNVTDLATQIVLFASGYITQAVVFLEQRQTGTLYFGKIESVEAVLILCVMLIFMGFESIRYALMENSFYGYRLIDLILIISAISGLKVIGESYSRIGRKLWPLVFPISAIILMIVVNNFIGNNVFLIWFIAIASVVYNQEYLIGHLVGKQNFFINLVPILAFIISLFIDVSPMVVISVLAMIVIIRFIVAVNDLRKHQTHQNSEKS